MGIMVDILKNAIKYRIRLFENIMECHKFSFELILFVYEKGKWICDSLEPHKTLVTRDQLFFPVSGHQRLFDQYMEVK